jgi:hypothetical protein
MHNLIYLGCVTESCRYCDFSAVFLLPIITSLRPSDSCKDSLDVSKKISIKGIDGILLGDTALLIFFCNSEILYFPKSHLCCECVQKEGHEQYIMVTISGFSNYWDIPVNKSPFGF